MVAPKKTPTPKPPGEEKKPKASARKELEDQVARWLDAMMLEYDIPRYERQYVWLGRKTFDFAWDWQKIGLEVEGGTWNKGRHGRGSGIESDIQKYNLAALHGWKVYRVTTSMIAKRSPVITLIGRMFGKVSIPQK